MNYTYKQIWLINLPIMVSLLMEQLINLTDSIFLGHVSQIDLGASALAAMYYTAIYMLGSGSVLERKSSLQDGTGKDDTRMSARYSFRDYSFCLLLLL